MTESIIQDHLSRIQGNIKKDNTFAINKYIFTALDDFNIYGAMDDYKLYCREKGISHLQPMHSGECFAAWLLNVKSLVYIPDGNVVDPTVIHNHEIVPVCPTHRDIFKTLMIMSGMVGLDHMVELSGRDIYLYAVGREIAFKVSYDLHMSPVQNVKSFSAIVEKALAVINTAWVFTVTPDLPKDNIPSMENIMFYGNIPASTMKIFAGIKTGA